MATGMGWERASLPAIDLRARVLRAHGLLLALGMVVLTPLVFWASASVHLVVPAAVLMASAVLLGWLLGRHAARMMGAVLRLDLERHGLREAYDRARADSLRDGLTGLGNHRAFQEELDELVTHARETRSLVALLLVDVDDLKKVNDSEGHAAGDVLLEAMGRIIRSNLRRSDRGYRIGGDEFAVVLPGCGPEQGHVIGRRILAAAIAGARSTLVPPFSVTVGVSAYPDPSGDRQQLIHQADAALYWGKRHGRTDVQIFDPERHGIVDDARSLPELSAAVARVADAGLLLAVYQPIFNLRTGAVTGYEGLVRPTSDAGFSNASALFIAAEASQRTVELDLASARAVIANIHDLGPNEYLSVNLSPRTLEADAFNVQELLGIARRHKLDPRQLVIELTEREAVEDMDRLRLTLEALRRHGIRVAADDVGAGNAGLRLLSELEFDLIKIDLSLVRSGTVRDPSQAVLRALQQLARRQRRTIVAEGIENADHLRLVTELGFDGGQGYYLGRPRQAADALVLDLAALLRDDPGEADEPTADDPATAAPGAGDAAGSAAA